MLIDKEQFAAWYLQAKSTGNFYCLVDMNERIMKSKGWINYHETYTVNKTGEGIIYELVFKNIWNKININPLFNNPDNEYVVLDEKSNKDFKGYDFYYYDDNEKLISLDVKHSTHPVLNYDSTITEYGISLINKAKSEEAMYLYAFDIIGGLLVIDVANKKFINKIDSNLVSDSIKEVKGYLLSKQIFNQNLKFY